MGQTAQHIVKENHDKVMKLLNQLFAEEWLAYYQYWIGAQVAKGPMRTNITEEFMEHANEELNHATHVAKRIIELGGTPILDPKDWEKYAKCRYEAPEEEYVVDLLKQNLTAERCAIAHYQQLCELCEGKDYITFRLAEDILKDEVAHEQEIEDFLNDIASAQEHMED